ncbi:hypothetical protein LJC19_06790 [Oxalobacter sp. OttesenSCG-928-P03]|nr:hypothetical protein [Oxalobacter sp. OttesenSCG-928-P03]
MTKRLFVILLVAISLSACTRSIDGYSSDLAIVSALSAYSGQKISVQNFESSLGAGLTENCRGYAFIRTPDGEGFTQYIQNAFITELELAGIYAPDSPVIITGKITQISLSTLARGEWTIKMTLTSNNGRSISAREQMFFKSNIVGESACQVASDYFSFAVQNLLRKLITSPQFALLLRPSSYPHDEPSDQPLQESRQASQATPAVVIPQTVTVQQAEEQGTQAITEKGIPQDSETKPQSKAPPSGCVIDDLAPADNKP